MAKKHEIEICLYGNNEVGFGWLLRLDGKLYGDGEPKAGRDCTRCLYEAKDIIYKNKGNGPKQTVTVFAPGGELMAIKDLPNLGWFGSLSWQPAPVYEISAEAIIAAASAPTSR